ncbi:MAG: aldo/keto reductase [candidate division KSB1 bacterium]|jgi:aryl-alcohol dehydrogenase-like predicted oxidoreductase|nr:aldo/keto reductase [candidate division KSB1 bacterium]
MKDNKKCLSRRDFFKISSIGLGAASAFPYLNGCTESKMATNTNIELKQEVKKNKNGGERDSPGHCSNDNLLAQRILGKTGMEVSLLAFGGGSQFMKNDEGEWEPLLERAIEEGINYFDTANNYNDGDSEIRYGKILSQYRDRVYVATKLEARGADSSKEHFERCLKRLKMDYVDVLLIHALDKKDNLIALENGVYKSLIQFKNEGTARCIGFSIMNESDVPFAKSVIENFDVGVVLGVINPMGNYGNCAGLLQITKEKGIGFLAMKTLRGLVSPETTAKELITYALDRENVTAAVIGHHGIDKLEKNITIVKEYALNTSVPNRWSALEKRVNQYVENRKPVWTLPGYHDGMMV